MAGLDLLAKRKERTGWDEAAQSGRTFPISIGDKPIANLGPEMPLTALEPLKEIDSELVLLVQSALAGGADAQSKVMDFLVAYPDLPGKAVRIAIAVGRNLFGEEGLQNFLDFQPSLQDVLALVGGISGWYGVSVGEASGSSESSVEPEAGTTSTQTSDTTTPASTPETPSEPQETAA